MGTDVLTERLVTERDDLLARAQGVKRTAAEQGRDLAEAERNNLLAYRGRIGEIDAQLELTTADLVLDDTIAQNLARFGGGRLIRGGNPWEGATAGAVLWDWLHRGHDQSAADRVNGYQRHVNSRAAEHMGTSAANTVPVAGGFGGLLVSATQGPIIDLAWQGMPFVTALGYTDLATANTFMRPRLVDPNLDAAGPQAGGKEKAELPSKHFDVLADPITLAGVGNYLNLSVQAETMVAGALDLVIAQLGRRTTRGIEKTAVAKLTATTAQIPLAADADAAAILAAIGEAVALVWEGTGQGPTWIAYGPQGAGRLIGVTDLAGRPLFPFIGASNAPGTADASTAAGVSSVSGLRPVLTPAITDGSFYVGNGVGLEVYVHRLPLLQAIEPSILGRQIAVAALVGTYQPPTAEAGPGNVPPAEYEGIVKLAP